VGCAGLNLQELLVILFVVVLVMGAGRLPQLGDALGRSIRNFKRALRGDNEIDVTPKVPREVPGPDRDDPRGGA
jgi:sec-independent protein translocase protein TatA